ncbi:hypothetical protein OF83DRAFT_1130443 [Amylostereum chailletii]|nr:hypothetical protein OF83DRAFT_1130443 [Amylostereum chailletii]
MHDGRYKAPTYQGCPVIRLPHNPDDVAMVLRRLCGVDRYEPVLRFDKLRPLLFLGKEFQIPGLWDEAVARLVTLFPPTLEAYDALTERGGPPLFVFPHDQKLTRFDYSVARLAFEFQLRSILPLALYSLAADEPVALLELMDEHARAATPYDMSVIQACYVGREALAYQRKNHTLAFFDGALSPACASPGECGAALKGVREHARSARVLAETRTDALEDLSEYIEEELAWQTCEACTAFFKARHLEGRRKVFAELGSGTCFDVDFYFGPIGAPTVPPVPVH